MTNETELLRGLLAQAQAAQARPSGPPPLGYQVELTVKGTRLCNLRCTYCHDWRSGSGHTMATETVEALTRKALEHPKHRVISFNWHGGEPLVLPRKFYQHALDLQAQYIQPSQRVTNSLQTNGVLLTDEWAQFFVANKFTVGVSLDGPAQIHNQVRVDQFGKGTFEAVHAGLANLRRNEVRFGVLVTLGRSMTKLGAEAVLDFLVSTGAEGCGLNPIRPGHLEPAGPNGTDYIYEEELNEFLIALYEERQRRGLRFGIRELDSVLSRLKTQGSFSCMLAGNCIGTFYVVEPNGDVGHCARFIDDDDFYFGNINSHSFDDIRASVKLDDRRQENLASLADKETCPTYEICNGGCPHERLVEERHNPAYNPGCCGRQSLIEYLQRQS
ncbi:MAG: radical SAM protein [Acidimicrobiia bacterium]